MAHIGYVNVIAAIKQLLGVKSCNLDELNHADVFVQKLHVKECVKFMPRTESISNVPSVDTINITQMGFVEVATTSSELEHCRDKGDEHMYYDVVASIYDEHCRVDSCLICGGFNTEEEAIEYIDSHNISEVDYYRYCRDDETAYIEIEEHNEDGAVIGVITVD